MPAEMEVVLLGKVYSYIYTYIWQDILETSRKRGERLNLA